MKREELPSIKNTIIGLFVCLFAFALIVGSQYSKARVNPTADTITLDVQCANGRMGKGKCPAGQELQPAFLAFSDLISGPDTGLGDGLGSGVIVTVWGQNLGPSQSNSTIEFCDSAATCRAGHVYYWKNADGQLPSGPANLYESHRMQEIAFSIPDSATGAGTIRVTVNGNQSSLPFTVRAGNIYHVKTNGNDSTGDGSFNNPWLTVAMGDSIATGGDTLYIHNVSTTAISDTGSDSYAYYNNKRFLSDETNQFAYVSFPSTRAELYGKVGVNMYETSGIVTSKLSVFASNCADETLAGCTQSGTLGIAPSDWGRVIGNKITDRPGMCASGQSGAISGGVNYVQGSKIYGNHIHDYGCPNSDKLHHTTYLTIRDLVNDATLAPPEVAFNYLKDNHAKNGLHFYDENVGAGTECGQFSGELHIHSNVVMNQGGNGISYESACGWSNTARIYNNLLINVGLPVDVDCTFNCGSTSNGIQIFDGDDGGIQGPVYVYNNTIYLWDAQNQALDLQSCLVLRGTSDNVSLFINDNVCYSTLDRPFYSAFSFSQSVDYSDNTTGSKNLFFTTVSSPTEATIPAFDSAPISADPLLTLSGSIVTVGQGSAAANQSTTTLQRDIYGKPRGATSNVGAIQ